MMQQLFITQEIGSIQRPLWRQKFTRPLDKAAIGSAAAWGKKLGIKEVGELVNRSGTGLLQKHGELSEREKGRIIEISTIYVIKMLEKAGLDRIFNGEQPRTEMYDFMARYVDGIRTAGTLNAFDANYFKKGIVESRVSIKADGTGFFADEFDFVLKHTDKAVKPCLTGPYTMADWSYLEYYRSVAESRGLSGSKAMSKAREDAVLDFAEKALNPVVKRLAQSGAKVIQIDEPAASTNESESELFVKAMNESFKGVPENVEKAIHLCYSNYPALFPALSECVANSYLIEFTNHASPTHFRPEDVDRETFKVLGLFREYGMDAKVGVGVIDIHSDLIETPEVVRDRLLYAAKVLGDPARVQANPDCGLRTRRWEIAYPKLCNMVAGARLARKELGG